MKWAFFWDREIPSLRMPKLKTVWPLLWDIKLSDNEPGDKLD